MSFRKGSDAPQAKKKEHIATALCIAPGPPPTAGEDGIVEVDGSKVTYTHLGLTDHFVFDHVFRSAGHQEVFDTVGEPIVHDTLHGYNSIVFAFGATGTGKTYSILGNDSSEGLLPRVARRLCQAAKEASSGSAVKIELSIMEIFHDKLFDLLQFEAGGHQGEEVALKRSTSWVRASTLTKRSNEFSELLMKEDKETKSYFVPDATLHDVDDFERVQQLITAALSIRDKSRTPEEIANHSSVVYRFQVLQKHDPAGPKHHDLRSRLLLLDLAGSEKQYFTDYDPDADKTVKVPVVNTNMNVLNRCITAVVEHMPNIPVKESVVTRFLAEVLHGAARGLMLAHASASPSEETLVALNLAAQTRKIRTDAKRNAIPHEKGELGPRQSSMRNAGEIGPRQSSMRNVVVKPGEMAPRQASSRNVASAQKEDAALPDRLPRQTSARNVAAGKDEAAAAVARDVVSHTRVAAALRPDPVSAMKAEEPSPKGHVAVTRQDSGHMRTSPGVKTSSPTGRVPVVRTSSGTFPKPVESHRQNISPRATPSKAVSPKMATSTLKPPPPSPKVAATEEASPTSEASEEPPSPLAATPASQSSPIQEVAPEPSPVLNDADNLNDMEPTEKAAAEPVEEASPSAEATPVAAAAPSPPTPRQRELSLSFQSSSYVANLESTQPPKYVHEVMAAVQALAESHAALKGIDGEKVEAFIKDLEQQVLYQPVDGLSELQAAAMMLWTSISQLDGEELSTLLNKALAAPDGEIARPATVLVHALNQLRVSATHRPELEPTDNVLYRTGSLPDQFCGFYREGAKFRVPNFLATYFERTPALEVVSRRPPLPHGASPVLWLVHLDPKFGCFHVNYVRRQGEEEYLFPPYSVMTVEQAEWSPQPSWQHPHVIHLNASVDNEGEPDVLPVAPWA